MSGKYCLMIIRIREIRVRSYAKNSNTVEDVWTLQVIQNSGFLVDHLQYQNISSKRSKHQHTIKISEQSVENCDRYSIQ